MLLPKQLPPLFFLHSTSSSLLLMRMPRYFCSTTWRFCSNKKEKGGKKNKQSACISRMLAFYGKYWLCSKKNKSFLLLFIFIDDYWKPPEPPRLTMIVLASFIACHKSISFWFVCFICSHGNRKSGQKEKRGTRTCRNPADLQLDPTPHKCGNRLKAASVKCSCYLGLHRSSSTQSAKWQCGK